MLIGIGEGLLNKTEPREPVVDNAYSQDHPLLSDNQRDALRKMEAEPRLAEWLGEDFVRIYIATKWFDVRLFDKQITALEYELLLPYL